MLVGQQSYKVFERIPSQPKTLILILFICVAVGLLLCKSQDAKFSQQCAQLFFVSALVCFAVIYLLFWQ